MTQLTIDDLIVQPVTDKVYSPKELHDMGRKWTKEDSDRWEQAVWEVWRRETQKSFITWIEACNIYRKERDAT